MATFITTLHFTEQGTKAIRDTCERAAAFKATAKKLGIKVTGQYRTSRRIGSKESEMAKKSKETNPFIGR